MGNIDCFEFCDDGLKYYQPSSQRISQLKYHYAPLMVIAYGHKFSVSFLLMHRSSQTKTSSFFHHKQCPFTYYMNPP